MGSTLTAGALLVGRIWLDVLLLVLWAVVEVPKQVLKWATSKRSVPEDVKIFKSVLITGASVGIGRGLARSFAGPGVRLVLTAFRKPSLEETVAECRGLGATVDAHYVDVKDRAAMEVLVAEAQKARPLDLVIAVRSNLWFLLLRSLRLSGVGTRLTFASHSAQQTHHRTREFARRATG